MNTFEFKCTLCDGTETTMKFDAELLHEVVANYEMFLRGCGYYINGSLDIVKEDCVSLDNDEDLNIDYTKEVSEWFKKFNFPEKKDNA